MVQGGRAELIDLTDNTWSEVYVRTTPEGTLQLELHAAASASRILTCEAIAK